MYRKTILENGITVVTESIPYFSTLSSRNFNIAWRQHWEEGLAMA